MLRTAKEAPLGREKRGPGDWMETVYEDALAQSIVLKSEVIGTRPAKQTVSPNESGHVIMIKECPSQMLRDM